MWFIKIIAGLVHQAYIITGKIHMQCNICMMCRIVIHQRNKQTNNINQAEQGKKEFINAVGNKRSIQEKRFWQSKSLFTLHRSRQLFYLFFNKISYSSEIILIHIFWIRNIPFNKFF